MNDNLKYGQIWELLCSQMKPLLNPEDYEILHSAFITAEKGERFVINISSQERAKIFSSKLFNMVEGILRNQGVKGKISTKIASADLFSYAEKQEAQRKIQNLQSSGLNPNFLFSNFVVGKSNSLAHAYALKISRGEVSSVSPLLIYGKSGLGKSHLMNACGNALLKNGFKKIICLSAVDFVKEYIAAISERKEKEFNEFFYSADALLLDDVQFLAKRENSQEVFFHHFNKFFDAKKPIVLTSDYLPREIPDLEPRLKTRFGSGSSAGIEMPDFEMRVAILKNKAKFLKFLVKDEILRIIAHFVEDSIRELEGALNNLKNTCEVLKKSPDEKLTLEVLGKVAEKEKSEKVIEKSPEIIITEVKQEGKAKIITNENLSLELIIQKVAEIFAISLDELMGEARNKEFVIPRQLSMFLAREIFNLNYEEIGAFFGGKNKSTVMRACNKTQELMNKDNNFFNEVNKIKSKITNNS